MKKPSKLASWNVNGLRAASKQYFFPWLEKSGADVVCLQEIKVHPNVFEGDEKYLKPRGYQSFWAPAEKAGYSGTMIYSKFEPSAVRIGMGVPEFDREGRLIEADFGELTVINTYFPNSQRDHARLPYKLKFCKAIAQHLEKLRSQGRTVLICGDFNIAHKEIDLRNPKSNKDNAGFLPQERAWLDEFTDLGWVDTFRKFEQGPEHYTWWSYRPGVRAKNVGWRLDYFFSNPESADRLKSVSHQSEVMGSDHCPVLLNLRT